MSKRKMNLVIDKSSTEEELIKGCRKQKAQAQKELYERFSGKMLGVCRRYIKDRSEAEEIMINGFMKVFSKISQFKGEGSFEGWVRRIMVNESLTYLRKNHSMYLEVDIEYADQKPNYSLAANSLEAEDLMAMVNRLPYGYRTVFNLYAIEGYTHQEIAKMLKINVNTSKSQLSRARRLLQSYLVENEKMGGGKQISHE